MEDGHGADSEAVKNMLSDVNSQLAKEEEGYLAEQKIQEQVMNRPGINCMHGITSLLQMLFASLSIPCFRLFLIIL